MFNGLDTSLVPRPSTPLVFDRLQYAKTDTAKTGGIEGLGMRLLDTVIFGRQLGR